MCFVENSINHNNFSSRLKNLHAISVSPGVTPEVKKFQALVCAQS